MAAGENKPLLGSGDSPEKLAQIRHDAIVGALAAVGYCAISIVLTLYNKWIMPDFKFPFCYFTIQQGISFAILFFAFQMGWVHSDADFKWTSKKGAGVLLIAFLFTAGLCLDLASLSMITASMNQVMKAIAPIFVMLASIVVEGKRYPWQQYCTAAVIVVGIILTALKNPGGNSLGVALCAGCIVCMVFQMTLSGKILSGTVKGPVEFMLYISGPSAAMALPFFLLTELSGVVTFFQEHDDWAAHAVQLLGGSFVALSLNICKIATIRYSGSAFGAICGNIKVAMVVVLATFIFGDVLSPVNCLGLVIATIGFVLHTQAMQRYKLPDRKPSIKLAVEKPQIDGRVVVTPTGDMTAVGPRRI